MLLKSLLKLPGSVAYNRQGPLEMRWLPPDGSKTDPAEMVVGTSAAVAVRLYTSGRLGLTIDENNSETLQRCPMELH